MPVSKDSEYYPDYLWLKKQLKQKKLPICTNKEWEFFCLDIDESFRQWMSENDSRINALSKLLLRI